MLSINNFVYTDQGIMSIQDLLDAQIKGTLPKLMSYDEENSKYFFDLVPFKIEEIADIDIYELKFVDVFTTRNITMYASKTSQIYQYNLIQTETDSLVNKNFQVGKYLQSNMQRPKLLPRWETITDLTNYANKSPNIGLGDTIIKFISKMYKETTNGYSIKYIDGGSPVPLFASINRSSQFNFILIKEIEQEGD